MRALILATLITASSLSAQTTFPLTVSIGDFGSYGYESPYTEIGAGIETRSTLVIFESAVTFSPTAKVRSGGGYSIGARGTLLVKPHRSLIIGGGVRITEDRMKLWTKRATRPFAVAGIDTRRWRVTASHQLPGSDPNALSGWSVAARMNVSPRVRIGGELFTSTFNDQSNHPRSASGFALHLDYIFGKVPR